MEIEKILKISMIFMLGFLSANLVNYYLVYGLENPFSNDFGFLSKSNKAPFDFIKENQIKLEKDKIIINIEDVSIGRYAPTGSMRPVLDKDANGIRVKPKSEDDIHVGDIISFRQENNLIVHRVIEKGTDENGVYFITKGDNNTISDGKVRFKDIEYITVGVLY